MYIGDLFYLFTNKAVKFAHIFQGTPRYSMKITLTIIFQYDKYTDSTPKWTTVDDSV